MSTYAESPLSADTPTSGVRRARPALSLLSAFGRGFTLIAWAAVVVVNGVYGVTVAWGLGPVLDFALMALAGFLFVFLFEGVAVLVQKTLALLLGRLRLGRASDLARRFPAAMLGRLIGILLMVFGNLLWPESIFQYATLVVPGKIIVLVAGVAGGLCFAARTTGSRPGRVALAGLAALISVAAAVWLFYPGTDGHLAQAAPLNTDRTLDIDNPGLPGPYAVRALSYGSGDSERRPEFGADAALTTPTVDGTAIYDGYDGFIQRYYEWYNGFDFARLPLNGLVWYPEGDGPFPLVLIVHGNHSMTEASDPGYAYLGEHLAGHGMIAVSVDENFLNGHPLGDPEMAEMPLRAWLLLKHLEQWRAWNGTPGNPFYGRVDLDRVGLIGHSRGGEAVAHAAEMNVRLAGDVARAAGARAAAADEYNFGIRAVVALAPCDNRYKPEGRTLRLNNVDYLLLASGHDGDMTYLDGLGQYTRATFSENPDGFKALVYLYRGNHGNFNTVWGSADQGPFESLLLNRGPLLPAEAQQQAARVFITGFLEAGLNERAAYRALFYDTAAARDWLPDDIIVTQYTDAGFLPLDTNARGRREDLDVPGGLAQARDIDDWRAVGWLLRDGATAVPNRGLLLQWDGGEPAYLIDLPEDFAAEASLSPDDALSFTLGPLTDQPMPQAVIVEVESAGGAVVRLPLADFAPLHPPLPAQLTKASWIDTAPGYEIDLETPVERVDQTYDLPLAAFAAANPAFRPASLTAIRFYFEPGRPAGLMLDELGFRRP